MRNVIIALAGVGMAACTEPLKKAPEVRAPGVSEARLSVSDSAPRVGSPVVVSVTVSGSTAAITSFTARVSFDSTALRFDDEVALSDGGTRVANPQAGLLRVAGIASQGFGSGTLYAGRFTVLRPGALATLKLSFDEIHTTRGADAIVVAPVRLP